MALPWLLPIVILIISAAAFTFGLFPLMKRLFRLKKDLAQVNTQLKLSIDETGEKVNKIKALEVQVEAQEKQYKSLVENSKDLITLFDMEGNYTFVSRSVESMLGYFPEELIGKFGIEFVHPDDQFSLLDEPLTALLKGETVLNPHFRLRKKDGTYVWVEAYSTPIVSASGKVIAVQTTTRDITDRKNAESALAKTESLYRLISQNSQDFIAQLNSDGIFTFASPSVKQLLGYVPSEIQGKSIVELIHSDDVVSLLEGSIYRGSENESGLAIEFRMKKKDGSHTWVESSHKAIADDFGDIQVIQMSIRDVSVRKQFEEKLFAQERQYRLISTNSKDLISVYECLENPVRIFVSPSCKDILGYEQNEVLGKSPYDFIFEEDADYIKEKVHPITASGKPCAVQYRAVRKDGTLIWLESISSPYFDDFGAVVGFQTTARDITDRKQSEEELVRARDDYRKALAKSEMVLAEKDDLVGLLSHDLKSPVNQIKALIELMRGAIDNKHLLQDSLDLMEIATDRQLKLYSDVLLMLKSDQSGIASEPFQTLSGSVLIHDIAENLEWDMQKKFLQLVLDIDESIKVTVQKSLFIQALTNVVLNSIKFSPIGESIKISCHQVDQKVVIAVVDHGVGFAPEDNEEIFKKFTSAGKRGTNDEVSTGLGLYLARRIIENQKGEIRAHSEGPGEGAKITITLLNEVSRRISQISDL